MSDCKQFFLDHSFFFTFYSLKGLITLIKTSKSLRHVSLQLIQVGTVNLEDIIWYGGLQFRKAWKLLEFMTGFI